MINPPVEAVEKEVYREGRRRRRRRGRGREEEEEEDESSV